MATIRLIPSSYSVSNSSYLSVTNGDNMLANTDSTTYGQAYNSRSGTSSYYLYLSGFNFGDIPSGAIVNSFSIKLKGYESGVSTSSQYAPTITSSASGQGGDPGAGGSLGTFSSLSTSAQTLTATMSADWATVLAAGSNLTISINCRRASRNTAAYAYIYGAEILVDYTMPVSATVTSTLTGDGTISPSGAYATYEDAEYTLTITPTTKSDTVTATKDGVDITSSLVAHYAGGTVSTVLGTYTLVSGGFNGQGATYFSGIVGNGVDATQTTSNYYSSGSGTNAVFTYSMAFTDIPSNAVIESVEVQVNGHAESTSNSSEYMCVQLKSGDTYLSEQLNFKDVGTSNSTQTLTATMIPTVSQLASMVLECTLGYYGGAINGATCYVTYSIPGDEVQYYTYTYTVAGDATIAVTIGSTASNDVVYIKISGSWVAATKVYKKVNGSWTEQSDLTTVFDNGMNYEVTI